MKVTGEAAVHPLRGSSFDNRSSLRQGSCKAANLSPLDQEEMSARFVG